MPGKSEERLTFLDDCLTGAIEHAGYGFAEAWVWEWDVAPGRAFAVISDKYEDEDLDFDTADGRVPDGFYAWLVDGNTVARGIGVIGKAVMRDAKHDGMVPHNAATGERLYVAPWLRKDIMAASRENDAGYLDVVGYLAILECALFGVTAYG